MLGLTLVNIVCCFGILTLVNCNAVKGKSNGPLIYPGRNYVTNWSSIIWRKIYFLYTIKYSIIRCEEFKLNFQFVLNLMYGKKLLRGLTFWALGFSSYDRIPCDKSLVFLLSVWYFLTRNFQLLKEKYLQTPNFFMTATSTDQQACFKIIIKKFKMIVYVIIFFLCQWSMLGVYEVDVLSVYFRFRWFMKTCQK